MVDSLNICVVAKERIERCPPLLRLIRWFVEAGNRAEVFCVAGEGDLSLASIHSTARTRVHVIDEAEGAARKVRPLVEVPRLARAIRRRLRGRTDRRCGGSPWDVAFAYDPYGLLAAARAGLGRDQPLVYYSAELWDEPGFWPQRLAERMSRGAVAGTIVCQDDRLGLLREAMRLDVPGLVVPNSCFDYLPELRAAHPQAAPPADGPVVFLYQGSSHVSHRCLGEAIDAFGSIDADVRLRMQLVGPESDVAELRTLIAATPHPEHFEILGTRAYGSHFAAGLEAHAGLMLYRSDVSMNYRYCAPNKLYEYPMLGLPVLSSDQPHLRRLVEGRGFGVCVDPKAPAGIRAALERMLDPAERGRMAAAARQWYVDEGRYEVLGPRIDAWCRQLVGRFSGCLRKAG